MVIWYIYQVVAGIVRHIRTTQTGGGRHQFGSYVKVTIINNVSLTRVSTHWHLTMMYYFFHMNVYSGVEIVLR